MAAFGEPVVREVWPEKSALPRVKSDQERYFAGEKQSLAYAISDLGVLYLGHLEEHSFSDETIKLMPLLVAQCELGLRAVRGREAELEALREKNRLLEKLKESEAQLIQSSKLAAVGVLAAGIAHELNSPLGSVKLGLEYALKNLQHSPKRCLTMLEMAKSGLESSQEIVNKLLHYCREGSLDHGDFSINDVVQDAAGFLRHHLEQDGISLSLELGPDQKVIGNKNEIQQILSNLITNARDALTGGTHSAEVRIRTSCTGQTVKLDVIDQGPGVNEEIEGRIFDPFFTTKPLGEGTGLGLGISRQIAEKHGGTLQLLPSEQGAHFRLTLPLESKT